MGIQEYERYVKAEYAANKELVETKWVDRIDVMNLDRVAALRGGTKSVQYVFNHTSQLDYFIPNLVILKYDLPYPRIVAGSNLAHPDFKEKMCDFEKWGVIWHDRTNKSLSERARLYKEVRGSLEDSRSVGVFAEGGINREPEKGFREFKHQYFSMVPDTTEIVCVGLNYSVNSEKPYWHLIDKDGFQSESYFKWFLHAYLEHINKPQGQKGVATVNFSEPVFAGELWKGEERNRQISDYCRGKIEGLLEEIKAERKA